MITAKCGCKFMVDDDHVRVQIWPDPEEWEIIAAIPELEPPETPTGWAKENVIWPHEAACAEAQEHWVKEGMKVVYRLLKEAIFRQEFSEGLAIFRQVWPIEKKSNEHA